MVSREELPKTEAGATVERWPDEEEAKSFVQMMHREGLADWGELHAELWVYHAPVLALRYPAGYTKWLVYRTARRLLG